MDFISFQMTMEKPGERLISSNMRKALILIQKIGANRNG